MTPLEQAQAASRAAVYRARLANRRREIAAEQVELDRIVQDAHARTRGGFA